MPKVTPSDAIAGVWVVEPDVHGDERGRFVETYRRSWFPDGREMVQANRADRQAGAVVGLHYHLRQADYWYVPAGRARVVLHDLRAGGPTEGATVQLDLSGDRDLGVYIPPGVAHGFSAVGAKSTITASTPSRLVPDITPAKYSCPLAPGVSGAARERRDGADADRLVSRNDAHLWQRAHDGEFARKRLHLRGER